MILGFGHCVHDLAASSIGERRNVASHLYFFRAIGFVDGVRRLVFEVQAFGRVSGVQRLQFGQCIELEQQHLPQLVSPAMRRAPRRL